jgi:hypothetical protein
MVNFAGWTFVEFIEDGKAPFSIWMSGQPEAVQAAIDARILTMKGLAKEQWSPKWISAYRGYDKLVELRIPYNKVQYRPLGCYGPDQWKFTILAGAIERNFRIPKPTLHAAMLRMKSVLSNDRRWVREYNCNPAESVEETTE